jgi:hypothetical protein
LIASLAFNLTQYLKKFCFLIIFLKISILCLFIYFSIKLSWYLVLNHGFNIFTRFGLNFFHYFLIFLDIEVVIIILNLKKKCIVDIFSTIKIKKKTEDAGHFLNEITSTWCQSIPQTLEAPYHLRLWFCHFDNSMTKEKRPFPWILHLHFILCRACWFDMAFLDVVFLSSGVCSYG